MCNNSGNVTGNEFFNSCGAVPGNDSAHGAEGLLAEAVRGEYAAWC